MEKKRNTTIVQHQSKSSASVRSRSARHAETARAMSQGAMPAARTGTKYQPGCTRSCISVR